MSWQYRKSKKVGPFRFTASKRGISSSVGFGGYRVTRRADGSYQRTVRTPGTGIYNTSRIGSPRPPQSALSSGVGFGVGFMLGRLLFWPLLIIGVLLLIFAWKALLVWGLIIIAIVLTRRYMRQRQRADGFADINASGPLAQAVCQILDASVKANGTLNIKDALNTVLDANPSLPAVEAASLIGEIMGSHRPQYGPLIPANVGTLAEDAYRERVFLQTIAKNGVNIRQPLDQAQTVCQVLDTGVTFEQMSLRVAKLNDIPPLDAARFVGTAIAAYCPRHNSLMEEPK
jgi:membrane protein implicated in regulation of membrane protease activity